MISHPRKKDPTLSVFISVNSLNAFGQTKKKKRVRRGTLMLYLKPAEFKKMYLVVSILSTYFLTVT